MQTPAVPLALVTRSGRVESVHYGAFAVADTSGRLLKAAGDPEWSVYLRSAAKPFQAVADLHAGAGDTFDWTAEEIAVVCASHAAEPVHLAHVRRILEKAGLAETDLRCGPHPPVSAVERDRLNRAGEPPRPIHNNCSGKHAGMLAACVASGWSTANYLEPNHRVQQTILEVMGRFAGAEPGSIPIGVDGCGVPSFSISLRGAATAFARLARPDAAAGSLTESDIAHARRVAAAMADHPRLVAGTGRFNTRLLEFTGPRVAAKGGAEGVFCAAVPEREIGIALKIADGSARAHPAVVCRLLRDWIAAFDWDEFLSLADPPLLNTLSQPIGRIELAF